MLVLMNALCYTGKSTPTNPAEVSTHSWPWPVPHPTTMEVLSSELYYSRAAGAVDN